MKRMEGDKLKIVLVILVLMMAGLAFPDLLEQWRRGMVRALEDSVWQEDKGLLILAAAQVVAYNALVMFPYVGGAAVLAHYLAVRGLRRGFRYGLPMALAASFHYLAFKELDYPLPLAPLALVMGLVVTLAWRTGLGKMGSTPHLLLPGLIVLGVQSLTIAPALAPYGLARGDLTWETVLAGRFLKGEDLLNFTGITFCLVLLAMALGAAELIALYRRRLMDAEELRKYELQYQRSQMQVQELRVLQEMHTLVHDLKTPLMTIQGLNSLLQIYLQDEQLKDYTRRIEGAVDNLNKMISEILYDDVRKAISPEELVKYVRAHVPVKIGDPRITFHLADQLPLVEVNLIRMARALINLIENAITATAGVRDGRVQVRVSRNDRGQVVFAVQDNGAGIPEGTMEDIWATGYSTKAVSAGLGLGFVKRVVENHHGTIEIKSQPGQGTLVRVVIPGVAKGDENPGD